MGKAKTTNAEDARPMPPVGFGEGLGGPSILPARGMRDWIIKTFVEEDGRLFNPEHAHLLWAPFECLWAVAAYPKQGRTVIGLTEELAYRVSGWQRWRQEQQIAEWFGAPEPAYLITFAADFCREAADSDFCALVEHELYHIGHKKDEFGAPAFTKEGLPKLFIRGHDVEEFVGVVERYGVGRPDGALARLVAAGSKQPSVSRLQVQHACGTCLLKVA
jgi:hypothetical protein